MKVLGLGNDTWVHLSGMEEEFDPKPAHCKKLMVTLPNVYGYVSCICQV